VATFGSKYPWTWSESLFWWFLGQIWIWVTWGQKLDRTAQIWKNFVIVVTFLTQLSSNLVRMLVYVIALMSWLVRWAIRSSWHSCLIASWPVHSACLSSGLPSYLLLDSLLICWPVLYTMFCFVNTLHGHIPVSFCFACQRHWG
jgi:hypothetical protein